MRRFLAFLAGLGLIVAPVAVAAAPAVAGADGTMSCSIVVPSVPTSSVLSSALPTGSVVGCTGIPSGVYEVYAYVETGGNTWILAFDQEGESSSLPSSLSVTNPSYGGTVSDPNGAAYVTAGFDLGRLDGTSVGVKDLSSHDWDACYPDCGTMYGGLAPPTTYNPLADSTTAADGFGSLAGPVLVAVFVGVVGLLVLWWATRYIRRRALGAM